VRPVLYEGAVAVDAEDEGGNTLGVDQQTNLSTVEEAVYEALSPRDRAIFDFKTGKHGRTPMQNQEIAARLGVTPALISQRSQQIADQISSLSGTGVL
jgi:DNA-directed RNA polymerase specialized sigma subunit